METNTEKRFCHDCQADIIMEDEEIKNGVFLSYEDEDKKINVFKCNDCFEKNKALTNFRPCEVYSRVVGYIRPVQQWHKGKKQEFEERIEFKNPSENCSC